MLVLVRMALQKIIWINIEADPSLDGSTGILRHPAVLLQLDEPDDVEVVPLDELPLPGEEEPDEEVLVGGVSGSEHEVGVADDNAGSGGEEGDGLHDVPGELPEGEAEEEADLQHGQAEAGPQNAAHLLVCCHVDLFFPLLQLL